MEDQMPGNLPYIIELEWWGASYSFGIDPAHGKQGIVCDPFREYRTLEFRGTLIVPTLPKLKRVEGRSWFAEAIDRTARGHARPSAVGFLTSAKGVLHASVYVPDEMYHPLLTLFAAGQIRFIQMNGSKLHYGRAALRSYDFDFDAPEDHRSECINIWKNDAGTRHGSRRGK